MAHHLDGCRLFKISFCLGLGFVVASSVALTAVAAEDNYLSAIEAEAGRVEANSAPKVNATAESRGSEPGTPGGSEITRTEFERILSENYHGSYTFYKKLQERSRQEIFESHLKGVSMRDVRKKIMDRFLQR